MQHSNLPYRYWFAAMYLITATKNAFSSAEIQRQLGHKRYQPIWEMVNKLRDVMGKRDGIYTLDGEIELDDAFFTTEIHIELRNEALKRGRGSQKKTKVLVIAESKTVENPKPGMKPQKGWTPKNDCYRRPESRYNYKECQRASRTNIGYYLR